MYSYKMENKRMGVFVVVMLMIGTLMVESREIATTPITVKPTFPICYTTCFALCLLNPIFLNKKKCPEKCGNKCLESKPNPPK